MDKLQDNAFHATREYLYEKGYTESEKNVAFRAIGFYEAELNAALKKTLVPTASELLEELKALSFACEGDSEICTRLEKQLLNVRAIIRKAEGK